VTAGREQRARQVVLPALAALVSLGQGAALGFAVPGAGSPVTPLRLALLGVAATWAYLAWRDASGGWSCWRRGAASPVSSARPS